MTTPREALAELVRLKNIKDYAESLNTSGDATATVLRRKLLEEHSCHKDAAWQAARAALAVPAVQPEQPQTQANLAVNGSSAIHGDTGRGEFDLIRAMSSLDALSMMCQLLPTGYAPEVAQNVETLRTSLSAADEEIRQLVRALRAEVEPSTFMGEPISQRPEWCDACSQSVTNKCPTGMCGLGEKLAGYRRPGADGWTRLYRAVNELMADMGANGSANGRGDLASAVMDALYAIDGGTYLAPPTGAAEGAKADQPKGGA